MQRAHPGRNDLARLNAIDAAANDSMKDASQKHGAVRCGKRGRSNGLKSIVANTCGT